MRHARLPCTDAGKAPILDRGIARGSWRRGSQVVPLPRRRSKQLKWRAAFLAGALCAALTVLAPGAAQAQGFFDFLFGGPQRPPPPPPSYPPPPPQIGRIAPAPLGQERVNENAGTTGHGVAFCVRLCDGQHFPLERMANAAPAMPISTPRSSIASVWSPIAPATARTRSGSPPWTSRPIRPCGPVTSSPPRRG